METFSKLTEENRRFLAQLESDPNPLPRLSSSYYSLVKQGAIEDFFSQAANDSDAFLAESEARKDLKDLLERIDVQYAADLELEILLHLNRHKIPFPKKIEITV